MKAEPEERTDPWNHARYHVQAKHGAYDAKIKKGAKVISVTAEKGSRKEPTE